MPLTKSLRPDSRITSAARLKLDLYAIAGACSGDSTISARTPSLFGRIAYAPATSAAPSRFAEPIPVDAGRNVSNTLRLSKNAERAALNSPYHSHTRSM